MDISETELQDLYTWVDEIPLSRPKRNIARDFSDGVMMAEVVMHFFPKVVELHNYSAANGFSQKMYNWNTLNSKVFSKLGFTIPQAECEAVVKCVPMATERVLNLVRHKFAEINERGVERVYANKRSSPAQKNDGDYASHKVAAQAEHGHEGAAAIKAGSYPTSNLALQEQTIRELKEMNEILETKTRKLEQLVRLKDAKIQTLLAKMQASGLADSRGAKVPLE